ncbi:MAG: hypothetical protein IJ774_14845 [Selenomonadaceae bacterium]|nr:hypothetical protein [Selenomonadaceae bacterium]
MFSFDAENFFEYALELFSLTGHTDADEPEFANHTASQVVYVDNKKNLPLNQRQRGRLKIFDNISRLFTTCGVAFFSANLSTSRSDRSQAAHDAHVLIHASCDDAATVCLFRHADKIILSFASNRLGCLLSDWYAPNDENFFERLDIANFPVDDDEYFRSMVHLLARRYYFTESKPTAYSLLPIDFFTGGELSHKEFEDFILAQKFSAVKDYGDDYVECDATQFDSFDDTTAELDSVLLEAENVELVIDNEEPNEDSLAEVDAFDEFAGIDSEDFADPSKLLEKISMRWSAPNE